MIDSHCCLLLPVCTIPALHAEHRLQFGDFSQQGGSVETNVPHQRGATKPVFWETPIAAQSWSAPLVWQDKIRSTASNDCGSLIPSGAPREQRNVAPSGLGRRVGPSALPPQATFRQFSRFAFTGTFSSSAVRTPAGVTKAVQCESIFWRAVLEQTSGCVLSDNLPSTPKESSPVVQLCGKMADYRQCAVIRLIRGMDAAVSSRFASGRSRRKLMAGATAQLVNDPARRHPDQSASSSLESLKVNESDGRPKRCGA